MRRRAISRVRVRCFVSDKGEQEFLTVPPRSRSPFYLSRLSVKRARGLVEEVGNAATRLESSFESRRATIRNLAVLRSIEDQAHEVSSLDTATLIGSHGLDSIFNPFARNARPVGTTSNGSRRVSASHSGGIKVEIRSNLPRC